MNNYYIRRSGCPDCEKVDRWLAEIRAIMPELSAAADSFTVLDETIKPEEAARYPHSALPAFVVDGEVLFEGPISKRAVLGLLQDEMRRMQQ